MQIQELTKKFTKKNVPEIRVGDTVRISYKITEGSKNRIQAFEGLVIAAKNGKGLDGTIKVRRVTNGIGVERTFPLHSPLIVKFEKTKSFNPKRAKLYFVRDLIGKKAKKVNELKEYTVWEEKADEEELARIEAEKAQQAADKQAEKEAKEKELEEKFEQAVASHMEENSKETEEKTE